MKKSRDKKNNYIQKTAIDKNAEDILGYAEKEMEGYALPLWIL